MGGGASKRTAAQAPAPAPEAAPAPAPAPEAVPAEWAGCGTWEAMAGSARMVIRVQPEPGRAYPKTRGLGVVSITPTITGSFKGEGVYWADRMEVLLEGESETMTATLSEVREGGGVAHCITWSDGDVWTRVDGGQGKHARIVGACRCRCTCCARLLRYELASLSLSCWPRLTRVGALCRGTRAFLRDRLNRADTHPDASL